MSYPVFCYMQALCEGMIYPWSYKSYTHACKVWYLQHDRPEIYKYYCYNVYRHCGSSGCPGFWPLAAEAGAGVEDERTGASVSK